VYPPSCPGESEVRLIDVPRHEPVILAGHLFQILSGHPDIDPAPGNVLAREPGDMPLPPPVLVPLPRNQEDMPARPADADDRRNELRLPDHGSNILASRTVADCGRHNPAPQGTARAHETRKRPRAARDAEKTNSQANDPVGTSRLITTHPRSDLRRVSRQASGRPVTAQVAGRSAVRRRSFVRPGGSAGGTR
jgi:hypothetical protein